MHELTLAFDLVDRVSEILQQEGASEAKSISITIGKKSGVDRSCFEFAFPEAAKGSNLEKAELLILETEDHTFQLNSLEVIDV